jgi:NitT/TauT family transport system permease protein
MRLPDPVAQDLPLSEDGAAARHWSERRSVWDVIPQPVSVPLMAAAIIGAWQAAVSFDWVSEFVLPPPADVGSATWNAAGDLFTGGVVWTHFSITARETLLGFLLAAASGFVFGALVAETAFGRRVLRPFLVAFYAAPKVAFAPLFVAWFGFGLMPKIVMAAVIAFFPLFVDTAAGLSGLDENQDKLFRSLRASRLKTFVKLKLPNALPFVFAGLKTAAVLSIIGAIVGEFMGGGQGLGALLRIAVSQLALDRVFAYVIILSVMASLFYALVDLAERRIVFWRKAGFLPLEG